MNLEQVARYTEYPQELKLQDATALKTLAEKYPYSSVYSLLYLTALSNGKSPDLDMALQQHAYRLTDRTRLYHLLSNLQPEVNFSATAVPEPAAIIPVEPTENTSTTTIIPEEQPAQPVFEPVASDGSFEELTKAFTLEQHFEIEAVKPSIPEPALPVLNPPEIIEEKIQESVEKNDQKSFTSWLKSGSQSVVSSQPAVKKPEANKLIDKFIEEEPTIARGKTAFYSPSKKAKESLDEETVPVSETLALIYAAQGNYPKAIHVYHQLMLSFPEKKTLFAVQIEELKKKITA